MIPDGTYVAVLDRFEGDQAVLLVEDGERVVGERVVREGRVPAEGRHQDAVLRVRIRNGHLVSARADPEASERRITEAQDRFDRLAERPGDGDGGDTDDGA